MPSVDVPQSANLRHKALIPLRRHRRLPKDLKTVLVQVPTLRVSRRLP